MRLLRHILVWLAMVGLLAPGASGAVLCIEAGGQIAIEQSHAASTCAPVCATPATDGAGAPVPDECIDLALVECVSQNIRPSLPVFLIAPPAPAVESWLTPTLPAEAARAGSPAQPRATAQSISATVLRI